MVENRAVLANEDQKKAYYEREAARRKAAEKAELSRRLQIAIISDPDVRAAINPEKEERAEGLAGRHVWRCSLTLKL